MRSFVDDVAEQKKQELYKHRADAAAKAQANIEAKFPYLNMVNNSGRARRALETDNGVSKGLEFSLLMTPLHTFYLDSAIGARSFTSLRIPSNQVNRYLSPVKKHAAFYS